ncbi:MAG: hypothetical protein E7265_11260 [Lachnospiraceae bacterium]|nr:hypothetical protein [Lachnospiraceae bacterium]
MTDNSNVLCACSSYEAKYYFNNRYDNLPRAVKEELQIMCVVYTEEVGGELTLAFSDEGQLLMHVSADEDDILFDEIGSALKIKQMQINKQELFEQLETYYKVMCQKGE